MANSPRFTDDYMDAVFSGAGLNAADDTDANRIGVVVGGSLSKGLTVRLDAGQRVEDLAVGRYVVVHSDKKRFFCMITDIVLDNTNPDIQSAPPDFNDPFLRAVYSGTTAFGKIHVQPMLSFEIGDEPKPMPVKTIPGHFMRVKNATADEVNNVFGQEDAHHWNIGSPLELDDTQINLDLSRLVQRSIGIFGKSGTGKSFFTRMLLAGVIAKKKASALIFDMHNDYGGSVRDEGKGDARGLRQLFTDGSVVVGSLDPFSSNRRGAPSDFTVTIGYNEIVPEDLEMLRETMGLSDAMLDAAHMLRKRYKDNWVVKLLDITSEDIDLIEEETPTRAGTLAALQRRVQRFERWNFLVRESVSDSIEKVLHHLISGHTVVMEFGQYGNILEAYMLVANYITRRIHERYVDMIEKSLGDKAAQPPQLLIAIEEAHKFLDPRVASQTIFGTIAREMRKYNVTLLVIDQRPSGIDDEVMSQIGTRVTALLDNERDISAVLTGISGAGGLREVLARLDTKQQAIIMGHAVPMPVVLKTRPYDQAFYNAVETEIRGTPIANGKAKMGGGGSKRY
jgi:DNA helicase HerA-like ATPase